MNEQLKFYEVCFLMNEYRGLTHDTRNRGLTHDMGIPCAHLTLFLQGSVNELRREEEAFDRLRARGGGDDHFRAERQQQFDGEENNEQEEEDEQMEEDGEEEEEEEGLRIEPAVDDDPLDDGGLDRLELTKR